MATTITLTGRLADITSQPIDASTKVTVKAPAYSAGPGVELTTSQPVQVPLSADGQITIRVVEGVGWLCIEGAGWSDNIRFVAAAGMTTIWEAVVNALPDVLEAKRLITELGQDYEQDLDALEAVKDSFAQYVQSTQDDFRRQIASLNEAFASSTAGSPLPPYLTQASLADSFGFYVTDEASLDYAIAHHTQIVMKPGAVIPITSRKNIPEGMIMHANGATIDSTSVNDFAFEFKSGCKLDGTLTVKMTGSASNRGVLLNGKGIHADRVRVLSSTPGAGSASGYASGVSISGSSITVGEIEVENFDYGINVISNENGVSTTNVSINSLMVRGYLRGVWVRDVNNLTIRSGSISGASPNSGFLPGHNGLLAEGRFDGATSNIRITLTVEDSGEHGFRVGGQFPVRNIWLSNCHAKNTGGCGFKALGGVESASRHYNIHYAHCIVEDAGQASQNQSAFLIERVVNGSISNATVRKNTKTYSAFTGVRINNCQEFIISNCHISDVAAHGFDITGYSGSCERVTISGGVVKNPGNCGINIDLNGTTFRRVSVTGRPLLEVGSGLPACRVSNSGTGGGVIGGAFIEFIANGSSVPVSDLTKSFIFDIYSDAFTDVDLVNGSTWRTRNDGVIRRKAAGVWGVL